mgnify:CR=1 FL=1
MLTKKTKNAHDSLARQTLEEGTQFLRSVTQLADKREVEASEDIFSRAGIKLVSGGTRLSGKYYDHLVAHKLLKPIEQSLSITDAISAAQLFDLICEEARRVPSLCRIFEQNKSFERLQGYFYQLEIPAQLALRLSVMQEDRPELFQHSLTVGMLCMLMGVRGDLPPEEQQALALAGIFHDVGELYLDPSLLAPGHRMDNDERRYLYTHPITGFLILRCFSELPKGMATAVLRHHERMNGRGYPYGLLGGQIDRASRYLAVAEVVASLLTKIGADSRINMKLRLNLDKLDAKAVGVMCTLFGESKTEQESLPDDGLLMTRLTQLEKLFDGWTAFRTTLSPAVIDEISYFDERVEGSRRMVLETGFGRWQLEDLLSKEDREDSEIRQELNPAHTEERGNSEIRQELMVMFDELSWQFQELTQALERKLADYGWSLPVSRRADFNLWMAQVHEFIAR